MHRNALLSLLEVYKNKHPEETETLHSFMHFVQENVNCFERSLAKGHVTGSAWLVNRDHSKILLTHHRKLNKWLQLGGHADGESNIGAVALREAYEESGLKSIVPLSEEIFDIDIHRIPENPKEEAHFHYDVRFALEAQVCEKVTVSLESYDLSWISILGLHKQSDETSMLRMRQKWLSKDD
ncbi:MAG: NUDIX hydrolase [Nitrospirota bacterium]|nr:NUDIX hydrolase [Nitrospirota bacterium]